MNTRCSLYFTIEKDLICGSDFVPIIDDSKVDWPIIYLNWVTNFIVHSLVLRCKPSPINNILFQVREFYQLTWRCELTTPSIPPIFTFTSIILNHCKENETASETGWWTTEPRLTTHSPRSGPPQNRGR